MITDKKMRQVKELLAEELGDDIFFSFMLFQHKSGDVWHTKHIHNFDKRAVRDAMMNIVKQWDDEGYEEDSDFFSHN